MAEENTEFEEAQGEADSNFMFFLERQDINQSIFCVIYNWCVVSNHCFPNKKESLRAKIDSSNTASVYAKQEQDFGARFFFVRVYPKLGQRIQLSPCWMSFFFAN